VVSIADCITNNEVLYDHGNVGGVHTDLQFTGVCIAHGLMMSSANPSSTNIHALVAKAGSTITVTYTLTDLIVNGSTFNGTATIVTSDAAAYTSNADLTVTGLGQITYAWTGSVDTPDGGAITATVAGTGTQVLPQGDAGPNPPDMGAQGWVCKQNADTVYNPITDVARELAACYPGSGTVQVIRNFDCTKVVTDASTLSQTVSTTSTIEYLGIAGDAGSGGEVAITIQSEIGDAGSSTGPTNVAIPWTCPTPPQPDGGTPDAAVPDAEPDAGGTDSSVD